MKPGYLVPVLKVDASDDGFIDMIEKHIAHKDIIYQCLKAIGPYEITFAIEGKKISLRQLARNLGYSATYLCKIRQGEMRMPAKMYIEIYYYNRPGAKPKENGGGNIKQGTLTNDAFLYSFLIHQPKDDLVREIIQRRNDVLAARDKAGKQEKGGE